MIINGTEIGANKSPFVIAEVGQAHEGSLGNAFAFVDVASECGVNAVKFQTHIASEESTVHEPWRIPFSRQDSSRYDYWKRMEFSTSQWLELKEYVEKKGLIFLSSPFSLKACDLLLDIGVEAWKVASGEMHNPQLINYLIDTNRPMILSTGLSPKSQVRQIVADVVTNGTSCAVLHCTTMYPTPPESVGLNVFESFCNLFDDIPVGISDHSGTIYPSVVSAYQGASIFEVHLTLHEKMFGPDVSSSLSPEKLTDLVIGVNFAWRMRQSKVDKDNQLGDVVKEKTIFSRSIVANSSLKRGHKLSAADLGYKKPGGGLDYSEWDYLLGRKLVKDVSVDHILEKSDVE